LIKALEGTALAFLLFMTNQMTRAAIMPSPARPPTTPPAMAPALEPPFVLELEFPEVLVERVLVPVLVRLELDVSGRVDTGGSMAVASGWSPAALAAVASHRSVVVTLRYAQCGMAVPPGISDGY